MWASKPVGRSKTEKRRRERNKRENLKRSKGVWTVYGNNPVNARDAVVSTVGNWAADEGTAREPEGQWLARGDPHLGPTMLNSHWLVWGS